MAKGHRGKQQQTAATANGPSSVNNRNNKTSDKENSIDTQNSQPGKGRNRNREKPKIITDEKPEISEDVSLSNSNHVSEKKDLGSASVHPKVQPTTEQLMIAKIIDHSDDPHQRKKIQQVMDVTGKPEDEVATALFDAAWDESRAVELLLEDGDHLSAWEETGKKKKGKKASGNDDKEDWDDNEGGGHAPGGFQDPREKSRQRGPPRMRRGGSNAKGGRGDLNENGDQVVPSGNPRGGKRGEGPPRRGGRGGGGGRTYSSRQQSNGGEGPPGRGPNASSSGGFQGSIDTWNNPNDQSSSGDRGGTQPNPDGAPGGPAPRRGGRGGGGGGRGGPNSQSGKDAFDNAGNWGDDFPQADDWDNEEYTGSLADTKVFTASGGGPASGKPRQPGQAPQNPQQQPVGANSQRGGGGGGFSMTNGPASAASTASVTNNYPQSIDLSTLLQKPTTQSSVGGQQASAASAASAPGAQFNQQATENLKAVVGIGQNSTPAAVTTSKDTLYSSYAQASAFTTINKGAGAASSKQPGGRRPPTAAAAVSSKVPAVEMPGDSLGRLDVQFGGLDLQFGGGSASASNDMSSAAAASAATAGGFEFGTDNDKTSTSKTNDVSFAPTAKEVNKSLSNALTSGGKLNPTANTAPVASTVNSGQQDSFSKPSSAVNAASASAGAPGVAPSANSSSGVPLNPGAGPVAPGPSGGSGNFNKQPDLYSGYNNYNKGGGGYNNYQYQYPNSNNFSQQGGQQGSSAGSGNSGSSAGYKGGQYDKYDPQMNNPAAAVLGLANTNTTNALSGKVSATTASKVNMPNLPPGVASMLHPQYVAAGLAPAAFYGLQQPMYGAYGNTGLEDLAAIQRASASAGLHTLPTTGYYDPNNQFAAATSMGAAVANNRDNNLNSLAISTTSSSSSSMTNSSGFGSASGSGTGSNSGNSAGMASGNNVTDSTSSPGPASSTAVSSSGGSSQHHVQQQQQQQTAFNLAATNAFAQQMPPGYAYYFGNMGLQPYGATTPGHVYQPTAMTVPGAGATAAAAATSQFQKSYGTSYGSGYDTLGQQGNKDFSSNYSSNGQSKSTGGSAAAGTGKGAHQYWGNTLTSTQLW